ncbi:hypothetical protein SI65_10126 [Aspergillus cristatus]|uniref:Uncharacterized protein n=1 Tax=Aspergillus cristatus TaxID=573508 RepID=A0A1E3B0Q2_ASPCR|nr:hypothetical protein SI65_10126 [Aspergillus cristatus]
MEHTDFDSLEKQNPTFQDEQGNLLYIALGAGSKYHVEVALKRAPNAYDGGPLEVAAKRGDVMIM